MATHLWPSELVPAIRNTWSPLFFGFRLWNALSVGRFHTLIFSWPPQLYMLSLFLPLHAHPFSLPWWPWSYWLRYRRWRQGQAHHFQFTASEAAVKAAAVKHLLWGLGHSLLSEGLCSSFFCSLPCAQLLCRISSKTICRWSPLGCHTGPTLAALLAWGSLGNRPQSFCRQLSKGPVVSGHPFLDSSCFCWFPGPSTGQCWKSSQRRSFSRSASWWTQLHECRASCWPAGRWPQSPRPWPHSAKSASGCSRHSHFAGWNPCHHTGRSGSTNIESRTDIGELLCSASPGL